MMLFFFKCDQESQWYLISILSGDRKEPALGVSLLQQLKEKKKKNFKLLYDRSLKVLVFHCNGDIEEHINISIGG